MILVFYIFEKLWESFIVILELFKKILMQSLIHI